MPSRDKSMTMRESQGLEDLMEAADCVFNNDIGRAEEIINGGASSFNKLGQGLIVLLKTSLGFEGLWAKHAAKALAEAESISAAEIKKARPSADRGGNAVFPPGSAQALCSAQAQLSAAVVATMNQSMFEYMRGLYKIRQSYLAMKKLADIERARVQHEKQANGANRRSLQKVNGQQNDDAYGSKRNTLTRSATGTTSTSHVDQQSPFLHSPNDDEADLLHDVQTPKSMVLLSDEYTYTGTYLCFGIMLVGLGMIPSAFQYVLRAIGFKGNKERGMAMLWETTKFQNAHGALAALVLLSLYNALRSACDIIDGEGYPKQRCEDLVAEMTARYPKSILWILEQARMATAQGDLETGIDILSAPLINPPKQLTALTLIEKTMYQMYIHDYAACTEGFVKYTRETKYSHALYYYNAGCAQVEIYRALAKSNPSQAQVHKKNAKEYFHISSVGVDKKKLMATELPFDTFVTRKLNKWRAKAEKFGVDLVDAVGPSPIEEMIYYHGGHKWMNEMQQEQSLTALNWCKTSPLWEREAIDERCIYALLKGVILRTQGNYAEAKKQFAPVIAQDRSHFTGKLNDNWVQPSTHYEISIVAWNERTMNGVDETAKLNECAAELQTVSKWGPYELDARLMVKVKSAQDVVNKAKAAKK